MEAWNKTKRGQLTPAWGLVIVFAVLVLGALGYMYWPKAPGPGSPLSDGSSTSPVSSPTPPGGNIFVTGSAPQLVPTALDYFNSSSVSVNLSYFNPNTDEPTAATNTTSAGARYKIMACAAGYLCDVQTGTVPAGQNSIPVIFKMKRYDAALTMTTYNTNGITPNTVAANQTLNADDQRSLYVDIQGHNYHLIAGSSIPRYTAFWNCSNTTDWVASNMAYYGLDTSSCTPASRQVAVSAVSKSVVAMWDCSGDIPGTQLKRTQIGLATSTSFTLTDQQCSLSIVGWNWYTNTKNGKLQEGPLKDDGTVTSSGINVQAVAANVLGQ